MKTKCLFFPIKQQHYNMYEKLPISSQQLIIKCVVDLIESLTFTEYMLYTDSNNFNLCSVILPYLDEKRK